MKKYTEIELLAGSSIESAIEELSKYEGAASIKFNAVMLYSDVDDIESAYKKITGLTKAEFDEKNRERQSEYEREELEHEQATPKLTAEWIEKGKAILDDKYHELWAKTVPVRLRDLYRGMELGCCLNIVKQLNSGCELATAKTTIEEQNHSGMSFGLVCAMVQAFCDRGEDFSRYVQG